MKNKLKPPVGYKYVQVWSLKTAHHLILGEVIIRNPNNTGHAYVSCFWLKGDYKIKKSEIAIQFILIQEDLIMTAYNHGTLIFESVIRALATLGRDYWLAQTHIDFIQSLAEKNLKPVKRRKFYAN